MSEDSMKNDEYWRDKLSQAEYAVCRQKGTERPFTGVYWDEKKPGVYRCRCCKSELFDSDSKFDSGSGWPSFYQALARGAINEIVGRIFCGLFDGACYIGEVTLAQLHR